MIQPDLPVSQLHLVLRNLPNLLILRVFDCQSGFPLHITRKFHEPVHHRMQLT
jgi:hypothetical protein